MTTKRRRLAGAVLGVLAALGAVAVRGLDADAAAPAPSWGTFAHLATSDLNSAAARQVATQNYSVLILRGQVTRDLLADLHARRSGIVLLTYEKAAGLGAAETRAMKAEHPEWIAHAANGEDIHPRNIKETTLADLTNPDFRAWQAQQIAHEVALGADGAFLDTLGAYFPNDFYTARPVVKGKPVTDRMWRDGSVDLLRRVKSAVGKTVIANGFGLGSGAAYFKAPADADQLIAAADGVQIEGFTRWGDAPSAQVRKAPQWEQDLAFLELLGARDKLGLAYTKVNSNASNSQLASLRDYALASFLLGFKANRAYFGFDDGRRVPVVASETEWARGLGSPTATRARAGDATWSRPFGAGVLTVKVGDAPVVS